MNPIKLRSFAGIVVIAGVMAAGIGAASPGIAQRDGGERLGRSIAAAIEADGPIVTDAEKALIRERCGYAEGEWDGRSLMSRGGELVCGNGRRVDDPEVRAAVERIGERARARVDAVMNRPEVRRALSGEIQAEVRERMERLREEMPRIRLEVAEAQAAARRAVAAHRNLSEQERARIHADVERAVRRIEAIDLSDMERQIEESVERSLAAHRRHRRID
jgi:hypothetical protein